VILIYMLSSFCALRIITQNQSGLPMKLLLLPVYVCVCVCVCGVCVYIYIWCVCVYALLLDSTESVDSEPAQSSPPF
jgi:hypothetical protein